MNLLNHLVKNTIKGFKKSNDIINRLKNKAEVEVL